MIPATPPDRPAIVHRAETKLTAADVDRIIKEPSGASALIILLRDDRVDTQTVIDAINRAQETPTAKMKRLFLSIVETILPA